MNAFLKFLQRPFAVPGLVAGLVAFYALVRLMALPGLSADEAEQVLFAQSFQWGYDVANPPLYTWVLLGLFALFGKSGALVLGFKLFVVALIYLSLYGLARMTLGRERRLDCALVGLSAALIFFIGWHAIFNYSHSLFNAVFVIATFAALVRVMQGGGAKWVLALGLAIGLGVLTKYAFGLFLAAALIAALTIQPTRGLVLRVLAALALGALIAAPHGVWLVEARDALALAVEAKLVPGGDVGFFESRGKGLWNLLRAAFAFLSPLWLVVLVVLFKPIKRGGNIDERARFTARLLERTFFVFLGVMVAMIVVGGVTQFRPNYLFGFVLLPLWAFARLNPVAEVDRPRRIFAGVIGVALVASMLGLVGKALSDPSRCKKCQYLMPYEDIAQALDVLGFKGGTVFATWYPNALPGNLLLHLDDARMVSTKFYTLHPPARSTPGQCLLVWLGPEHGGMDTENITGMANHWLGTKLKPDHPVTHFKLPLKRASERTVTISTILLDPGQGNCQ